MIDGALKTLLAGGSPGPAHDDLESRSTEELETLWQAELQRLKLIKTISTLGGGGATIGAARFLFR